MRNRFVASTRRHCVQVTRSRTGTRRASGLTMRQLCLIAATALLLAPVAARAQTTWVEAFQNGDYEAAAQLLHPIVIEQGHELKPATDPAPARQLAMMYAEGLGVEPDLVLACTLAMFADMAEQMGPQRPGEDQFAYDASMKSSERFVGRHCDRLAPGQRLSASRALGSFSFGLHDQVLAVGGESVRIGRGGILMARMPGPGSAIDLGCLHALGRLRPVTVDPPSDAAPGVGPRHFLEVLGWCLVTAEGVPQYALEWQLWELRKRNMDVVHRERIHTQATWPGETLPADVDRRFSLEMLRSGHLRWKIAGAPPRRGWIELPRDGP
jgi:hypothetical protein